LACNFCVIERVKAELAAGDDMDKLEKVPSVQIGITLFVVEQNNMPVALPLCIGHIAEIAKKQRSNLAV